MITPENPLGGEKLPFQTDADRAALVGREVRYLRPSDIVDMGGKPHLFPQTGVVKAVNRSALLLDDGMRLDAGDIRIIATAA